MVAPLVGAWIEIQLQLAVVCFKESLPSWERGLKYDLPKYDRLMNVVAPLVGAWIEIFCFQ